MIYSYDKAALIPLVDIYDTQMMLAQVNAAKDMYEKGLEEMKEFNEKYGDFTSPIASHMQWVNDKVLNPTKVAINNLYANGIDPLRSMEGRALLSRLRNNIDLGKMAIIKQAAKNAEKYKTSADELRGKGLYDADYEAWRLNGKTLDNWDANSDSPTLWTETSAMPLRNVDSIVEPWVKNLEPSYDAAYTKAQNDGYDYSTVSKDRIMAVIDDALPEFTKTSEGGYYRYLAEQAAGGDKEAGDALLKEWMYNRASDHTQISRVLNPERKMALEDYYDAKLINRQAAKELNVYELKKIIDAKYADDGDGNKRKYSHRDDITEKGLKNMVGMNPTTSLGYDIFGNEITMMDASNNNPKFFKEYRNRLDSVTDYKPQKIAIALSERMTPHEKDLNNPNRITDKAVDAMTHSRSLDRTEFADFKNATPLREYGNNKVEGLGLVRLDPGDALKLYTKSELGYNIIASAHGLYQPYNKLYNLVDEDGKLDPTIVAHTDTSNERGIVTSFIGNRITSLMPLVLYKDNKMQPYAHLYIDMGYTGVNNSGKSVEWLNNGISTIYDGEYDTSGQSKSVRMDKSRSVGNSQVVSSSIYGTP